MKDLESLIKNSPAWKLSERTNELCELLLDTVGINYFDYTRFYKDGTFFPLFSDKEYLVFILNNGKTKQFKEYIPPTSFLYPGEYLWGSYISPDFLDTAAKKYKHFYGITIIRSDKNYDEVINFSAPLNSPDVIDIYKNQKFILDLFVGTIVDEFKKIFDKSTNRSRLPSKYKPLSYKKDDQSKIKAMLEKIYAYHDVKQNQVILPIGSQLVKLSKMEFYCLKLLHQGSTNKEIGKELNISPRTVETYFERLMQKIEISKKLKLLEVVSFSTLKTIENLLNL